MKLVMSLYTPDRDWLKEIKVPPQFVNIVEDVRIEKLMKRRYAGLPKTFYAGYQVLSEKISLVWSVMMSLK